MLPAEDGTWTYFDMVPEEIEIRDGRRVFTLVSSIQEEVHRFAIAYHKQKHTRASVSTTLVQIPGIGEKKAKALLKAFGSLKKIRAASEDALCAVPGLGRADARAVRRFFGERAGEEDEKSS